MCDLQASPGTHPIDELLVAAERFRARAADMQRSADTLPDILVRLRTACDALELTFARLAADFATTEQYAVEGSVSPIAWLRHHCHMTGHAAASAICVGAEAPRLQRSTEAMREGSVGWAHLVLLARTAAAVTSSGATFDEARLLRRAETQTPNRFRRDCAHARHAADAAAFLAAQREDADARFLELRPVGDDGCFALRGFLDAASGATVRAALEPLARRCGAGDDRDRPRRLADALVEISAHTLDTGGTTSGRHVPHLQVTTTLETLLGAPGAPAGELAGVAPISTTTVERLACATTVTRVLLGPDSAVVDVGRARRLPAPATRRIVAHRDQGCVWPGCDRPATWTQPHHVVHWSRGGVTEAGNLVSLCHRHHWMAHEGGWQLIRVAGRREVTTIPPVPDTTPLIRGPSLIAAV